MINIRCTDSTQAMAWVLFFGMTGKLTKENEGYANDSKNLYSISYKN